MSDCVAVQLRVLGISFKVGERTNEREWTKAQFTGAIKSRCIGNGMELAVMKFRRRLACPMPPRSRSLDPIKFMGTRCNINTNIGFRLSTSNDLLEVCGGKYLNRLSFGQFLT